VIVALLRQIWTAILIDLSTLRARRGSAAVVVLGIMALAGISTSMFSIATGAIESEATYMRPDRIKVLPAGSQFENQSNLPRESVPNIVNAPGVKKGSDG
jgi:hypothetical protein